MEHYSKAELIICFFKANNWQKPEDSNLVDPASYICLS